ncbi:MAG: tRNA pseudouridine(54/55) synthase Pus10 [Thermofilaceae archaeon]
MQIIDIVAVAKQVVQKYPLCNSCLGRLFGMMGYGLTNAERGHALKTILLMEAYDTTVNEWNEKLLKSLALSGFNAAHLVLAKIKAEPIKEVECYICKNLMDKVNELAVMCVETGKEYEYKTFQVGCSIPHEIIEREESLWLNLGLERSESIKSELTREIGKQIQSLTGKSYSLDKPDLTFIVDAKKWKVIVQPRPLFIYGRYKKKVRGLPQSPWLHQPDSRISYDTSIEELITTPLIKLFESTSAKLHAAGREDIDVRTLGSGRPFVVEIISPKVRTVDLRMAEHLINNLSKGLIEVEKLIYVDGKLVPKLKAFSEIARKKYTARVKLDQPISDQALKELEAKFKNLLINQRTPLRILGRKNDKVRKKMVYELKAMALGEQEILLEITCQGGLYVKELIHGDQGRTRPSVAEALGVDVTVEELDILWIEEPEILSNFMLEPKLPVA